MTGKLIVIEGGDGAGKATQAELLMTALRKKKIKTTYFDFPQYDTSFFGNLVGRALKGEFGDFRHLSPYLASLPYMLDRATARQELRAALKKGVVVCNRYTSSSAAFQSTKCDRPKDRKAVLDFIERAEYDELGIPRPDAVIYLHVPPAISFKLIASKDGRNYMNKKKGARDQHETDRSYQVAVADTYLRLARARSDWMLVTCAQDGQILSREEIHSRVMNALAPMLGIS